MIKAIVGANWGDEGKGKITDSLAKESDIVVRYQGGSNAGFFQCGLHQLFIGHGTILNGLKTRCIPTKTTPLPDRRGL